MNDRFFSSVIVISSLGNSRSACERFLVLLTLDRLYPLLIRLFLNIVSFLFSSSLSVIILLYRRAWLLMMPFLQRYG